MKRLSLLVTTVALSVLATACTGVAARGDVLHDLATDSIIPAYKTFGTRATELRTELEAFCKAPSASAVAGLQQKTVDTRGAWRSTEAMWIGPVMTRRSAILIDPPYEAQAIASVESSFSTIDADVVGKRIGANARGLGALEYLLSGQLPDAKRCSYVVAIGQVVESEAKAIVDEWTTDQKGKSAFVEEFAGEALDSNVGMQLNDLVNDQVNLLRQMSDTELGAALGNESKAANIDAAIEGPSGDGFTIMKARLDSLRVVLLGKDGSKGLSPLLTDELIARVDTALNKSVELIPTQGSLKDLIRTQREQAVALKTQLDDLRKIVTTEVVSHLGATVGFSDADGDSSG